MTVVLGKRAIFTTKPQFWLLNAQIWSQSLFKHFQTWKDTQIHIKFAPKHSLNKNHHLTHFSSKLQKPHKVIANSTIMITEGFDHQQQHLLTTTTTTNHHEFINDSSTTTTPHIIIFGQKCKAHIYPQLKHVISSLTTQLTFNLHTQTLHQNMNTNLQLIRFNSSISQNG
jgi:hypothetical protein